MSLDHEAIYKAYAGTVVRIDDATGAFDKDDNSITCLLYTSPSPRDKRQSRMPSSA